MFSKNAISRVVQPILSGKQICFLSSKTRSRLVQIKCSISLHDILSIYIFKAFSDLLCCQKTHLVLDKLRSINHKGISEGFLGIMLCTIQKKGFCPNRQITSFVAKSKRRPLVDWRVCRLTPEAIPATAFTQLPPPFLKI